MFSKVVENPREKDKRRRQDRKRFSVVAMLLDNVTQQVLPDADTRDYFADQQIETQSD